MENGATREAEADCGAGGYANAEHRFRRALITIQANCGRSALFSLSVIRNSLSVFSTDTENTAEHNSGKIGKYCSTSLLSRVQSVCSKVALQRQSGVFGLHCGAKNSLGQADFSWIFGYFGRKILGKYQNKFFLKFLVTMEKIVT